MRKKTARSRDYRKTRLISQDINPSHKFRVLAGASPTQHTKAIEKALRKAAKVDPEEGFNVLETAYNQYRSEPFLSEEVALLVQAIAKRVYTLYKQGHPKFTTAQAEEFLLQAFLVSEENNPGNNTDILNHLINFYYNEAFDQSPDGQKRRNSSSQRKHCQSKVKAFVAKLYDREGELNDKTLEKLATIYERKNNKINLARVVWDQIGAENPEYDPRWPEVVQHLKSILKNYESGNSWDVAVFPLSVTPQSPEPKQLGIAG